MRSLRLSLLSILALSAAASIAFAQTSTTAKKPAASSSTTHPATHTAARPAGACVQIPELSPKIPALPPGSPCPKALYTITTMPSARLDNLSPIEPSDLAESLGLKPSTFTLAYVDTQIGTGPLAGPHQYYSVHYTGYLTDGTKFDSSYDHTPAEPLVLHYGERGVIVGWDTGFAGMHVGGRRRLFIPYQLAYGSAGHPPQIPAKAELIFDIELVSVSDNPPPPPVRPTPPAQPSTNSFGHPSAAPAAHPATEPAARPAQAPAGSTPASANPSKP